MEKVFNTVKDNIKAADTLDNLASYLSKGDDIARSKMTTEEYIDYISALRYAIATLRGGKR